MRLRLWVLPLLACAALTDAAFAQPSDEPLAERVDRLIRQLGDDEFSKREQAQNELIKIGSDAFDALNAAEKSEDIEIVARAKYVVRLIRIEWTRPSDPPAVKTLLKDYEQQEEVVRLQRVQELVKLPDDAGLAAICRLARFEKSTLVAKLAALSLLEREPPANVDWVARERIVRDSLGKSDATAAVWLRTDVETHGNPEAAAAAWAKLVAAEEALVNRVPVQTNPQILSMLLRRQVRLLDDLHRPEEAHVVIAKIVEMERGSPESLPKLMDWLVERKAWGALDNLAKKFSAMFDQQPLLLYRFAQARLAQGQPGLAEEVVKRALALQPGNQQAHWSIARELQRLGRFDWAEREYRQVIATGSGNNVYAFLSHTGMAEMFHDQEKDKQAAETLQAAVASLEDPKYRQIVERQMAKQLPGIRSRMHFFQAKHLESTGDSEKAAAELEKGLELDPTDADALIALYRLPKLDEARRKKTLARIQATVAEFRIQIEQSAEDATPYNQLAWLVSNTEGDQAEALRCSLKSLDIVPGAAGYMDTLGRCYFASKDLESAVKWQSKAVELEPYNGSMVRQLKEFKDALAKKNSAAPPTKP